MEKRKLQKWIIFSNQVKMEIVQDLIPKSLKVQFYKALLDSYASEHGARMTAMHQATDNAQEMLKDLNLNLQQSPSGSHYNGNSGNCWWS